MIGVHVFDYRPIFYINVFLFVFVHMHYDLLVHVPLNFLLCYIIIHSVHEQII